MVSEILAIFIEAYARNKINGINNIAIILLTRKITKRQVLTADVALNIHPKNNKNKYFVK